MPIYEYKAKTMSGEEVSNSQKAKNKEELAKSLIKKNLILVSVKGDKETSIGKKKISFSFRKGVSLVEKMMFTRHLSVMISAGFPFDRSLEVLAHQSENEKFKEVINKIKDSVVRGEQFSEALKKHPKVFNDLYVNMTKIGEETGNLKNVLEELATQMKKDHDVRGKVKGAMMYPGVLVSLMTLIGVVMMIYVLPKFSQVFKSMNVPLPPTTQALFAIGDILAKFWFLLPIFLFIVIFGFLKFKKSKKGKEFLDSVYLKIPLFGPVIKKMNTARTARILSSLIKSGVPIVKSLNILSDTLTNKLYKDAIAKAAKDIQKGETLKNSLSGYENIYPYLLIQMIEVGEETGNLGEVLSDLAEFYEGEVDAITKNLSTIIEPVLMVIIGIAVAVFAVSIVQPMYSMMGSIH